MSRKIRIVLVLVVLAVFFGYRYYKEHAATDATGPAKSAAAHRAPAEPVPVRRLGSIAFKPCTLAPQFAATSVEAQCGQLSVAEDPARPDGRRIALNIAWVPADEDGDNLPDPVFMLAGGPGQAATETYPQVAPAFREVVKNRGVLLVDQRGTGQSNPLQCKDTDDSAAALDEAAMSQALRAATERCRDALSKQADLRFYTTTDAVRDLDAVRSAIGADSINLLGISYGTRVAQQYAMRHPDSTRTLVLDSVVPNGLILGNDFALNLEHALDLQFAQCEKLPACVEALGHPRAQLDALMAKLRRDPPLVDYRDASTGESKQERLQPAAVAGLMRMYAYMPLVSSLLPLELAEAAHGRYAPLMALSKMLTADLSQQMAMGMQLSVACSEDAFGLKSDPAAADTLLGNSLPAVLGTQCAVWPKGSMPADFHQPLRSQVPTLVLEGELDPVTPPRYGKQVVGTLPNARLLVLRGQGHNVIGAGCMPKLFAQFLDSKDAKSLDARCLDTLGYTPPFVSFNGWAP